MYGPPAVPLAVNTGAVAMPCEFVIADAVLEPPVNVPLAPLAGAANATVTLATGLFIASYTVACRGVGKAAFVAALCDLPTDAVTVAGGPTCTKFVSKKLAGVVSPKPWPLPCTVLRPMHSP